MTTPEDAKPKSMWQKFIELLDSICLKGSSQKDLITSHLRHAREHDHKNCHCKHCLDIILHAQTAAGHRFNQHDKQFVHRWIHDDHEYEEHRPAPPREVKMEGYSENFLEELDKDWWEAEQQIEHKP